MLPVQGLERDYVANVVVMAHHLQTATIPAQNHSSTCNVILDVTDINPYPTAFPYGNGMVLHFYQQQQSSTTKTVHKVINRGLKTYV